MGIEPENGPASGLFVALGMIFAGGSSTVDGTPEWASGYIIAGELALDGRLRLKCCHCLSLR